MIKRMLPLVLIILGSTITAVTAVLQHMDKQAKERASAQRTERLTAMIAALTNEKIDLLQKVDTLITDNARLSHQLTETSIRLTNNMHAIVFPIDRMLIKITLNLLTVDGIEIKNLVDALYSSQEKILGRIREENPEDQRSYVNLNHEQWQTILSCTPELKRYITIFFGSLVFHQKKRDNDICYGLETNYTDYGRTIESIVWNEESVFLELRFFAKKTSLPNMKAEPWNLGDLNHSQLKLNYTSFVDLDNYPKPRAELLMLEFGAVDGQFSFIRFHDKFSWTGSKRMWEGIIDDVGEL